MPFAVAISIMQGSSFSDALISSAVSVPSPRAWQIMLASLHVSFDRSKLESHFWMMMLGPSRYCSPRHKLPLIQETKGENECG